jgi:putative methyltransferase (TIGR04325 family)
MSPATIKELPLVRLVREWRYDRRFVVSDGFACRGVYGSFAEAIAAAPPAKPVGYQTRGAERVFLAEMARMAPSDYPLAFWFDRVLREGDTVVDFGGHVGTKYRALRPYLPQLGHLRWIVCDLPNVTEAGRALAADDGLDRLEFTEDFACADGADVLLSSGALQYVEPMLWTLLARLATLPEHVFLNKLPAHDADAVTTLQNIQAAFVPYRIYDRRALLREMRALGYELVDEWLVPDRHTRIPFHPEIAPEHYGHYFRRPR